MSSNSVVRVVQGGDVVMDGHSGCVCSDRPSPTMPREKIPVTMVTGFLGAGKTSLLNYLLRSKAGKRVAVIENEFGEVNIDENLVSDNMVDKEDLVCIENGCMCCSLRKDIIRSLVEIDRRSRCRGSKVDAVFVETTGLADPSPIAFTLFANPWVACRFKLDAIICVVDAVYLKEHLLEEKPAGAVNEVVQQLVFSDPILLNKVDLVDEVTKAAAVEAIRRVNKSACIIECQLNQTDRCPPLNRLLDQDSFSVTTALEADVHFLENLADVSGDVSTSTSDDDDEDDDDASACASEPGIEVERTSPSKKRCYQETFAPASAAAASSPDGVGLESGLADLSGPLCCPHRDPSSAARSESQVECSPEHQSKKLKGSCKHDLTNISSVGICVAGLLDERLFNQFMKDLLYAKARDIFRCKGVLAVHGYGNQKFVFQGIHETICYGPAQNPWGEHEPRVNKIVFIGRGLDRKALIEAFRTCVKVVPESTECLGEAPLTASATGVRTGTTV